LASDTDYTETSESMSMVSRETFRTFRIGFTAVVSLCLGALLLWQYLNDGIPSHYFLADKTMPLVSNAWGAVTIPLFTWLMLWRIDTRLFDHQTTIPFPRVVLAAFIGALVYGVILGVSITGGFKQISGNTPWFIAVAALLFPVYRAEYFLGFVLGLTYWIGGVLPIIVGCVFVLIAFALYSFIRRPVVALVRKLMKSNAAG
jgi:hypothetical protein